MAGGHTEDETMIDYLYRVVAFMANLTLALLGIVAFVAVFVGLGYFGMMFFEAMQSLGTPCPELTTYYL